MTDTIPELPPESNKAPFHYTTKGGVDITLPSLALLPFGLSRRLRKSDENEALFTMMEFFFAEDSPEMVALDAMDTDEMIPILNAWKEHSGVSVGESSAS